MPKSSQHEVACLLLNTTRSCPFAPLLLANTVGTNVRLPREPRINGRMCYVLRRFFPRVCIFWCSKLVLPHRGRATEVGAKAGRGVTQIAVIIGAEACAMSDTVGTVPLE